MYIYIFFIWFIGVFIFKEIIHIPYAPSHHVSTEDLLTYTMYVLVEPSPSLVIGQKIGSTNPAASFIKYLYLCYNWGCSPFPVIVANVGLLHGVLKLRVMLRICQIRQRSEHFVSWFHPVAETATFENDGEWRCCVLNQVNHFDVGTLLIVNCSGEMKISQFKEPYDKPLEQNTQKKGCACRTSPTFAGYKNTLKRFENVCWPG